MLGAAMHEHGASRRLVSFAIFVDSSAATVLAAKALGGTMRFASVLALAVLVPFIPSRARAADANLDPTFGTFGQTVVDVVPGGVDAAQDVLVQSDGAIVAAGFADGKVALVRATSTGALDAGFGRAGSSRPTSAVDQ